MTLKIAIVGCGKISDGHVDEIQKLGNVATVVACADLEPIMAEQLARRFDIPAHYGDIDRMLAREKPDVVHIATPPGSHLALTTRCLEAGAHVCVEKPLTLNYADSVELVKRVEAANKKLTIGYTYYFDPPALELRRLREEGELGEPIHVESIYGYNLAGPFGAALLGDPQHWVHKLPGKLFQNIIDHMMNKFIEFIDDDEPTIVAKSFARRPERFGDARDDLHDELRVMIMGEKVTGSALFSSHARPPLHMLRVYGTKNSYELDFNSRTVVTIDQATLPSAIGRVVPAFARAAHFAREGVKNSIKFAKADFHFFSGLSHLFAKFYESILTGGPPPISHRDILRVAKMLDSVYQTSGQGAAR